MEHVAIYCRLSKEDGDDTESNSIKTQKLIIENYCKRNGWAIYDTYVDDGYSGMNYDRPGFQRMHQDIIDAKVNVVITKEPSGYEVLLNTHESVIVHNTGVFRAPSNHVLLIVFLISHSFFVDERVNKRVTINIYSPD